MRNKPTRKNEKSSNQEKIVSSRKELTRVERNWRVRRPHKDITKKKHAHAA